MVRWNNLFALEVIPTPRDQLFILGGYGSPYDYFIGLFFPFNGNSAHKLRSSCN